MGRLHARTKGTSNNRRVLSWSPPIESFNIENGEFVVGIKHGFYNWGGSDRKNHFVDEREEVEMRDSAWKIPKERGTKKGRIGASLALFNRRNAS